MSHTPGEWSAAVSLRRVYVVAGDDNLLVADILAADQDERVANADLIAAAPDLLEACQRFRRMWDGEVVFDQQYVADAENAMRAAIAKAEGK